MFFFWIYGLNSLIDERTIVKGQETRKGRNTGNMGLFVGFRRMMGGGVFEVFVHYVQYNTTVGYAGDKTYSAYIHVYVIKYV